MTSVIALLLAAFPVAIDIRADVDYLVVDVRTRAVIEQHWPDSENAIPVGSLVKPFTALAYGGDFPEFVCHGTVSRCWLAQGHGRLNFRAALAHSCNAYFLSLAQGVDSQTLALVAARYGIPAPHADTAEARIGLGTDWTMRPLALTRAYCELVSRKSEPRVADILAGLRIAAKSGTAGALADAAALAKTGTATCISKSGHAGDGFTIVLAPADAPRIALLVRVHGVPGAVAAKSAAMILHTVLTGK